MSLRRLLLTLAGLAVLASASIAQNNVTFVGSTGTPSNEPYLALPQTFGRAATVHSTASSGRSVLRYNVPPTQALAAANNTALVVNYGDYGPDSRVVVRLYETDLYGNTVTQRMSFDSNWYAQGSSWQTRTVMSGIDFDFTTKAYYLEVELTKSNNTPYYPWIAGLQLYRY